MLDWRAILERAAAGTEPGTAGTGSDSDPFQANTLIRKGGTAGTAGTAEVEGARVESGAEGQTGRGEGVPAGAEVWKPSRESDVLSVPSVPSVPALQNKDLRWNGFGTASVPAVPEQAPAHADLPPRFRAWRARFADGRTMTVLNPAGMDHAEALAAVDRWPGCTVEPLPWSQLRNCGVCSVVLAPCSP